MAFDAEGYRKAAKEAGIPDDEIEKDIAEEMQSIAPTAAPADMKNVKVGQDFMGIPEWLQPAVATAAGVAAVGLGLKGASKLKGRMSEPAPAARIEPTFGIPDVEPVATQPTVKPTVSAPAATTPVATQQPAISGYGETKLNAPVGAPAPVVPTAPAQPVEPKPMSDLEKIKLEEAQIRLQAAKDKAAFDAQVREKKLESLTTTAKKSVEKQQKGGGGLSPMDKTILNNQITAAAASDVKETLAKKQPVPAPAAPVAAAPVAAAPVAEAAAPVNAPAPTAKQASNIKPVSLPSEWKGKGMNWLTSAYGLEGAKQFIDTYNEGKPFKSHDEMKSVYDKVMVKPSFSSIPKSVRQDRNIIAAEREQYKIVPGAVAPPSGGGGGAGPVIRGGGGGASGIGRAGEEIHNLNPLKL